MGAHGMANGDASPDKAGADRIGCLSWVTGSFLNRLVGKQLTEDSLQDVMIRDEALLVSTCYASFEHHWQRELALLAEQKRPSLARALWRSFRREFLLAAVLKLGWGTFILLSISFFVRELLRAINVRAGKAGPLLGLGEKLGPEAVGYTLCAFFFLCTVILSVCIQQMIAVSARLGLRMKLATSTAVYRKALLHDRHQSKTDIVSLVSTDCAKLGESCTTLQYLWSGIIEAMAIMGVLLGFVGKAALPGCGVMLLLLPFQYIIGIAISRMRKKVVEASDSRVNLMDEILRAVKLVKMYAWEKKFADSVGMLRGKETALARVGGWLKSANLVLVFLLPPVIALSIFGVYELTENLEGTLAFTTLSMFNTLRLPLIQLPKSLRALAEALAALERIQGFLVSADREVKTRSSKTEIVFQNANLAYGAAQTPLLRNITVNIQPGKLAMVAGPVGSGKSNLLQAIMGQMTRLSGTESIGGSFAYVPQTPWCAHGTVRENILFGRPYNEAFYKQVLFACALETDMTLMEEGDNTKIGERGMNLSGGQKQRIALARAAYSGANTYLLDAPLSAVDMYTCVHIFKHCLKGIMLEQDATVVLVTHQTELFQHADILMVMDKGAFGYCGPYDPVTVSKFFPNANLIAGHSELLASAVPEIEGITDESAVQLQVVEPVPTTVSLGEMPSRSMALKEELFRAASKDVAAFRPSSKEPTLRPSSKEPTLRPPTQELAVRMAGEDFVRSSNEEAGTEASSPARERANTGDARGGDFRERTLSKDFPLERLVSPAVDARDALNPAGSVMQRAKSLRAEMLGSSSKEPAVELPAPPEQPLQTVLEVSGTEERPASKQAAAVVAVRPPVTRPTKKRKRENGYVALFLEMRWYLCIISLAIYIATQVCRIYSDIWISSWVSRKNQRTDDFYVGIYGGYVATFAVLLTMRGLFFYWMGINASTRMHNVMFRRVLNAPMAFFTVTPLGHVLSTFSKDMDSIDEALMDEIHMFFIDIMILGTTLGVVIKVLPVFAAVAGFLTFSFAYYFYHYVKTSQVLTSLAGTLHGAVVAAVSETLQGMDVILAYRAEARFRDRNADLQNQSCRARYNLEMLQLWLSFRLDLIGCLLVLGTCLLAVILKEIPPDQAGLAVSNSFQILLFFSLMAKGAADIGAHISSVERVVWLSKIEPERDLPLTHETCPHDAWPSGGEVSFNNVVMSYVPHAPHVLKGVTFSIERAEKVGVAGRTGAGKSSLIMAVFRLVELSEGAVRLDGLDIKSLNLGELRRRIAIIPQEPVMFFGTLRSNLDPFGERTEEQLRASLDACLLSDLYTSTPEGLDARVSFMGSNFSLGQQQLLCLARAMLNPSKLLLLDEATAALDSDTDAAVQRVLRTNFADRTTITIAHRLDTIIDSDRILVMDAGKVAEFDTPYALLNRPSIFGELCRQTGGQYEALRAAAERHHCAMLALAVRVAEHDEAREQSAERKDKSWLLSI